MHDVATGRDEQANVGLGGDQPSTGAYYGALSPNGRYLTFYSEASNLVPNDTNGEFDVFAATWWPTAPCWSARRAPGRRAAPPDRRSRIA